MENISDQFAANKQIYKELCKKEHSMPIFSQYWWLDAVCGKDNWGVVLSERGGQISASLPFFMKNKYGLKLITMPKLTQKMGVWIKYPENQRNNTKLSHEKNIFNELVEKLPKFDMFLQNFDYHITNWLPLYWKGFKQTTNYTYVIEDISNVEKVFEEFDHAKRKNIKRAEKFVEIKYDLNAESLYENHKMTLAKQGLKISYSYELLKNIYDAAYSHSAGKTIYSIDEKGKLHSAIFVIWDCASAYDLISSIDPDYRNSSSASLLIREIIKYLSDKTKGFDFEGSMIESVETSFRQFGAIQKPYFQITKVNSRILKVRNFLQEILNQ